MKSHYNPCFWVALWNHDYFQLFLKGRQAERVARKQELFSLNLNSGKLLATSVESVHYEKGLTTDEVPLNLAEAICRKFSPADLPRLPVGLEKDKGIPIEFENVLSRMEAPNGGASMYQTLLAVARRGYPDSIEEKCALSCFVYFHFLRSLPVLTSLIGLTKEELDIPKAMTLGAIKGFISDPNNFAAAVHRLARSSWRFYRTDDPLFPLGDTAILTGTCSVMVACSPRLLLEILLEKPGLASWEVQDGIRAEKLSEYYQMTVSSSFREIVFSNRKTLADLQVTNLFQARVLELKDRISRPKMMAKSLQFLKWINRNLEAIS